MKKSDSKKISRSRNHNPQTAVSPEPQKDDRRINRVALNDNMTLTLGAGLKKVLDFKVRF